MFAFTKLMQAMVASGTVSDPQFYLTTLLLNTSSTNGAQNNTFLDSSTNNFTITRNGNTTQGTFTPFSQTGWSNYFSGGYLRTTSSTALGFSTNPFTIEAWVYMVDRAAQYYLVGGSGVPVQLSIKTNGTIVLGNLAEITASTGTVPLNEWTHVAFVRTSTATNGFAYYINGVPAGTTTLSTDLGTASATVEVATTNTGVGVTSWTGYISNIRVVKGTAVYTGAFTPSTTPLNAITNTSLLTCQSNRFVDNSSANATFTTSNASVQAFSPFAPTAAYSDSVVGGSGYFDGSGDYLSIANQTALQFGTGDFCYETWVYPTTLQANKASGERCTIDTGSSGFLVSLWNGTVHLASYGVADLADFTSSGIANNTWAHIAITRSGTSVRCFVNGTQAGSTATLSTNFSSSGSTFIGQFNNSSSVYQGYMCGTRLVKGSAVYTSNFTCPTAPPTAITNTSLLLNFTNAGIYDSASKSSWETVNNAQVSTAQAKWGTTSIYFPGSTSNQRLLPSQNYQFDIFGTGDFTIECWLYVIAQGATTVSGLWDQRPGVNGTYINWVVDFGGYGQGSSSNPKLVLYTNSAVLYASGVLTMGAWNHVALCRASGTTRMFINGTLSGTAVSDTNNYLGGGSAGNYRPSIGSTDGGDSLYGYIDDFRVTRYARYTTNFTAPTAAFGTQ